MDTEHSGPPASGAGRSPDDSLLDQLHGRRARLRRELETTTPGPDTAGQRLRIERDLAATELEIRNAARQLFNTRRPPRDPH